MTELHAADRLRPYSISTYAKIEDPLKDTLLEFVRSGWTSIELMCLHGHRELLGWTEEELEWLQSFGAKNGLRWSMHAPINGCNPCTQDEGRKEHAASLLKQVFQIAERLDANYIVMHAGNLDDSLHGDADERNEQAVRNCIAFLRDFLKDRPPTSKVKLALENVPPYPDLIGSDMETIMRIIREVDSPQLKVLFDAGHAHMRGEGECIRALRMCMDHMISMHLNDNNGAEDEHAAFGKGNVPIREIVSLVTAHGYKGHWVLETEDPASAEASAEVLNKLRNHG